MRRDLACPSCRVALAPVSLDLQRCPSCGTGYRRDDGIWRLLREGREDALRPFVAHYEAVRMGEGRRFHQPEQLRALPFRHRSGKHRYEWSIRARSFRALVRHVIRPLERTRSAPLRVLDLGSGLGWLAHRLARRGHDIAAVDLLINDFDGLGVHHHYADAFLSLQAEFDHLPVLDRSVDVVIFNAAFHYAADYLTTLQESARVLDAGGQVVILDTPLYRDASSGIAMVREREATLPWRRPSGEQPLVAESFLTYDRLGVLERQLGLRWQLFQPWYGLRWWSRRWFAHLRGGREPAQFKLVVGRRIRPAVSRAPWMPRLERTLVCVLVALFVWRGLIPAWRSLNTDFPNYYLAAKLLRGGYPLERVYDWVWSSETERPRRNRPAPGRLCPSDLVFGAGGRAMGLPSAAGSQALLAGGQPLPSVGHRACAARADPAAAPPRRAHCLSCRRAPANELRARAAVRPRSLPPDARGMALLPRAIVRRGLRPGGRFGPEDLPDFFVFYFLRKRQWRALCGLGVASLLLAFLGLCLFGFEPLRIYVLDVLPRSMRGENNGLYAVALNSPTVLLRRLFVAEPELNPHPWLDAPRVFAALQPWFRP